MLAVNLGGNEVAEQVARGQLAAPGDHRGEIFIHRSADISNFLHHSFGLVATSPPGADLQDVVAPGPAAAIDDLVEQGTRKFADEGLEIGAHPWSECFRNQYTQLRVLRRIFKNKPVDRRGDAIAERFMEIGRASCRERVKIEVGSGGWRRNM